MINSAGINWLSSHRSSHSAIIYWSLRAVFEISNDLNVLRPVECTMGNDSSKSKLSSTAAATHGSSGRKKLSLGIKRGPSISVIQRHLETAQKSRVLQLRNCSMKILPEQLQEVCEILRNLDVSQNRIRTLPTFIGSFSNLKQLHLSNNELESLPDEMGVLKKLEVKFLKTSELNLNQNRLNSLNATNLVHCEALRILRLEENCLNKTDFISDFLINSNVSLIAYAGNLFQDKDFQSLPGYEEYQNRYTATKRKM
ncbi:unnamed protein product [Litomosoides sigmodontis]|uniref:Leucine-rich repeat-containing protein 57 n=1 Tax=Litomosoides sigmodontis TaxID=42156 RepID=A0A3P6SMJ2_LITSI|nr:unnamed protein product [Litomosoides sigmodontis]